MFKILNKVFADKGFYINLNSSTDRKVNIENLSNQYNIENFERFEALTDEMIQYSCTKSHLAIFQESLENDFEVIFVAEDDMQIENICYTPYTKRQITFDEALKNIHEDLQKVEWDVILFGCNPKIHLIPITNTLAVNYQSTGAWAYLIKKRAYKFLLENSNYKRDLIAIDDYLPLLNKKGFVTLSTIPMVINHAVGFESTLQPRGPVNYDSWIRGNYHKFLYDNYSEDFSKNRIEKKVTVVIAGHFVKDYLYYLNYLLHSLPEDLKKCRFIVHYDESSDFETNREIYNLSVYFKDYQSDINLTLCHGFGGLISTFDSILNKIKTPYFIFLEHDWVFLEKDKIDFSKLLSSFETHNFINAVWFGKDDNQMRGFEISRDVENNTTPFEKEMRVEEVNLVTTCRWSNNPAMFRLSKMKDWFENIIKNPHVGKVHQSQHNVEESMIPYYRKIISENKWSDIRDDWGTFLYGDLGEGPFVGHTDASRRYQGIAKSQPEINGENYIKNNPLNKIG